MFFCDSSTQKYYFMSLIEKPIEGNFSDTALYLFHSNSMNPQDSFLLTDSVYFLLPDIPSPGLVTVDNKDNYYISNAYENLKILDKFGNFVYKFDYPKGYYGTFSSVDEENNIYIRFYMDNENLTDTVIYKVNAVNRTAKKLTNDEIPLIDDKYLTQKNEAADEINYKVIPSFKKIKTIFAESDGRFVSPDTLIVYKVGGNYDRQTGQPDEKDIYDKVSISGLTNDKVIYINSWQVDKNGDILLSGVKSNDIERIKIHASSEIKHDVKISNIKFFIWKLIKK
jgi:hypothetical protein